jgi:hypothetical protein
VTEICCWGTATEAAADERCSVRPVSRLYNEEQLRLRVVVRNWLVSRSRVLVTEAWGHFGNQEERERLPLEVVTIRVANTAS